MECDPVRVPQYVAEKPFRLKRRECFPCLLQVAFQGALALLFCDQRRLQLFIPRSPPQLICNLLNFLLGVTFSASRLVTAD
jgi:hypothetical protein